jgi:decaprenylphospho-beta-D-erythro-pentofuranosid-2-ulose 2-reductase
MSRGRWKHAVVVGASSGIGEAVAYELAKQGLSVALIARRGEELKRAANKVQGAVVSGQKVLTYQHDVTNYADVPELFQRIAADLGGLDLIIYSAGVMPEVAPNEYNFAKDKAMIDVNVLGGMAWLNEAAMRFQNLGGGTIVGISSIAGERGRRGTPAYYASKAAFSTYLESLRNRLSQYGVQVTTIKPGLIRTVMTAKQPNGLWMISAEEAAEQIVSAARSGAIVKYVPWKWRMISFILHSLPSFIFRRLNF